MARNPFEQLQDVVSEPRQAFEDVTSLIIKAHTPSSRRVRIHRGDGGIDVCNGTLGSGGHLDVYQVKHFPDGLDDSQKQQIRNSYKTAANCPDYKLKDWYLCLPIRLKKEDLRWFDEWKSEQPHDIHLLDGDDLTEMLHDERCTSARATLKQWGVLGLLQGGPVLLAEALIQKPLNTDPGLSYLILLRIRNDGDKSARGLKVVVKHSETGCVVRQELDDWLRNPNDGSLNPRNLRLRIPLNPGEASNIMRIPLVSRSPLPLAFTLRLTAEDTPARTLHCTITQEQLQTGVRGEFSTDAPDTPTKTNSEPRFHSPTSPFAIELLDHILAHSVADERGLTVILDESPTGPLDTCIILRAVNSGPAYPVRTKKLKPAIEELLNLGWLLEPVEGDSERIYELNPEANAP